MSEHNKTQKYGNALALATLTFTPAIAFANGGAEAPDVSSVVTYLGLSIAALTAIGVAKMIPAAVMWMYSSLVTMVKRG